MRLIYGSEVYNNFEAGKYTLKQAHAIQHNLGFFEKAMDKLGYKNPLWLGSRSGKFLPNYADAFFWDWNGLNMQGADFGMHGSGKTSRATLLMMQFNFFVRTEGELGLPCLIFDRKGGEHLSNHEPLANYLSKPLKNLNLIPFGTGARQVNVTPAFLTGETHYGREKIIPFKMSFADFLHASEGDDWLDRALGIEETTTESEAKKYDAARRVKSDAIALCKFVNEKKGIPLTFSLFKWAIEKTNEKLGEQRKSIALESKLRGFLRRGFFGDNMPMNFLEFIKQGKIINYISSTRLALNHALQVNEFTLHARLFEERKARQIKQVFVFSDEHDLISEAGATDNLLKGTWEMIAGKERWASNAYLKSTQFPNSIPLNERKELDWYITSRLDAKTIKALEPVNNSEAVLHRIEYLHYPRTGLKQCALVTKDSIDTFYQAPPFCMIDVEQGEEVKKRREEAVLWT